MQLFGFIQKNPLYFWNCLTFRMPQKQREITLVINILVSQSVGSFLTCDTCSLGFQYEYALRHLYALVNLCERGYPADRYGPLLTT